MEKASKLQQPLEKALSLIKKNIPILGLLLIMLFISIIQPRFLSSYNIISVLRQASINGLLAFGLTIVIISGGIDLSVGSTLAVSSMVMALSIKAGVPAFPAVLFSLLVGSAIGVLNGLLISKGKLQPFIATLGTMMVFRGVTLYLSEGLPVSKLGEGFIGWIGRGSMLGIPVPVYLLTIVFLVFAYFLKHTTFGKRIYAIGGNEKAARLSGVKVENNIVYIYMISGLLAALAGVILTSRIDSAVPTAAKGYELTAIAAAVIGGASLSGGKGKATGTIIGILIIAVITNGLNLIGVSSYLQQIITGVIILTAVLLDGKK